MRPEQTDDGISDELKTEILTQLSCSILSAKVKVYLNARNEAKVNLSTQEISVPQTIRNYSREIIEAELKWVIQKALDFHEVAHVLFSAEIPDDVREADAINILRSLEDPRVENLFSILQPQAKRYFKTTALFYTEDLRQKPINLFLAALCMSLDSNLAGTFSVSPNIKPLLEAALKICEDTDVLNGNFNNCCETAIKIAELIEKTSRPSAEAAAEAEKKRKELSELRQQRDEIGKQYGNTSDDKEKDKLAKKYHDKGAEISKKQDEIISDLDGEEKAAELKTSYVNRLIPEDHDQEDGSFNGKLSSATAADVEAEKKKFETRILIHGNGKPEDHDSEEEAEDGAVTKKELSNATDTDHHALKVNRKKAEKLGRDNAQKLREKLKLKSAARHNKDSGNLSMKLLKKQLQRRGKIYSSRLFKTNEKLQREHSVMVLCDYSGSMDNPNKLPLSKEAMISLATMLKELKVNFCLRAFSSTDSNPAETEDLLLKNFGEELSDKKISDIIKTYSSMGSNRDGTAIKNATDKLSAERGAKLLIVISDGKPAAYKYNGSPARKHTIEAIRRAEKKGIKVIGVGIADGANTVPELYKRHVCIGDIQQLSEKLIKLYVKAAEELSN